MIINPREITFVRFLIPLLLGILVGYNYQLPTMWSWLIALGLLFPMGFFAFKRLTPKQLKKYFLVPSLFFFILGWSACSQKILRQTIPEELINKKGRFLVELTDQIKKGKYFQSTAILLAELNADNQSKVLSGKIHLTWSADSSAQFDLGNRLAFEGTIAPIQAPKNPNTFDFKNFKAKEGIQYSAFVATDKWHIVDAQKKHSIQRLAKTYQTKLLAVLGQYIHGEKELDVAKALILGDRSELDKDLQKAYGASGALHVLAVSGLHVGIIYLLINFLLTRIFSRKQKWVKWLLTLLFIWAFVLITGASPSVIRAAIMFSLISLGSTIQRYPNVYNILAIAAFGMLLFNPFLLFNLSFQLSFTAILSIVFFQPRVYRLWYIENRFGDYIWKLISLGVAAQIGTLPITLFYFHQFPVFFWLSGIIVVPAASLILMLGLLVLLFNFISTSIAELIGTILEFIIWHVNACIFTIEELPMSTISGVWIPPLVVAVLYTALLVMVFSQLYKKRIAFYFGLSLLTLAFLPGWLQQVRAKFQNTLVVYHQPYGTLIDHWSGHFAYHYKESEATGRQDEFIFTGAREKNNIRKISDWKAVQSGSPTDYTLLKQGNDKLLLLNRFPDKIPVEPLMINTILLRNTPKVDWENFYKFFDCQFIIADGTNKPWETKKWKTTIEELNTSLDFWDTSTQGAFIKQLK